MADCDDDDDDDNDDDDDDDDDGEDDSLTHSPAHTELSLPRSKLGFQQA